MSNPPSVPAPNPYFSGIIYNPTDFLSVSGDSALTYSQAIALFIQKTISDSVTGITNFVSGLTTSSILAKTITDTCNLWTNATGEINIGTLGGRSALIHIGDGNSNVAGSGVHINNGTNTASNVQILNGTGSTGTINLGSSTSTIHANCPLTLTYSPSLLTATNDLGHNTYVLVGGTVAGLTSPNYFTIASFTLPAGVWILTGQCYQATVPFTAWLAFSTGLGEVARYVGQSSFNNTRAGWLQITVVYIQATSGTVNLNCYQGTSGAAYSCTNNAYSYTRIG